MVTILELILYCSIWLVTEDFVCFGFYGFMVFYYNIIFNYISVISWRSVLLVEESSETGENHRPVASDWQILSHNVHVEKNTDYNQSIIEVSKTNRGLYDHMVVGFTATCAISAYHH
jgi:hypothetical protein